MWDYYPVLRPFLFSLPTEAAHGFTLQGLNWLAKIKLASLFLGSPLPDTPKTVMGLTFPNCVGLAAGLDKNAEYLDGLATLGFGFIEIGTITPKPQTGNPKPRLFRIKEANALINRMGFNNVGVDKVLENIKKSGHKGILGINISKNAATPIDEAHQDYLACLEKVYPYASYIAVNVSSPNTPQLRRLQFGDALSFLLKTLKETLNRLQAKHRKKVPLILKVSPDLAEAEIEQISDTLLAHQINGLIATNTTVERPFEKSYQHTNEPGGLSGRPLAPLSEKVTALFAKYLKNKIPIIASGGIMTVEDAKKRFDCGASLIQLYTGLIYRGPGLIREIIYNNVT